MTVLTLPEPDFYSALGLCATLFCSSDLHGHWPVAALTDELIPPLQQHQFQLFSDHQHRLIGLVTWAWVDAPTARFLAEGGSPLPASAWCNGSNLYIADFIAPWGHARAMTRALRQRPDCPSSWFGIRRSQLGFMVRPAGTSIRAPGHAA